MIKNLKLKKEKRNSLKVVFSLVFGVIFIWMFIGGVRGELAQVYYDPATHEQISQSQFEALQKSNPIKAKGFQQAQNTFVDSKAQLQGYKLEVSNGQEVTTTPVNQHFTAKSNHKVEATTGDKVTIKTEGGSAEYKNLAAKPLDVKPVSNAPNSPTGSSQPTCGSPDAAGAAGAGGDGSSGGGAGGGKPGDAAVKAGQEAMGIASSALGAIKDVLATNGKGKTAMELGDGALIKLDDGAEVAIIPSDSVPSGGLCDYQEKLVCGNITYDCTRDTNKSTASTTNKTNNNSTNSSSSSSSSGSFSPTGDCITGESTVGKDCVKRTICIPRKKSYPGTILAQNDKTKTAETKVSEDGTLLQDSKNLEARVIDQANIYTPRDESTDILLKGSNGNPDPLANPRDDATTSATTGKAIADMSSTGLGDQFVKLTNHDLDISGRELRVRMFKSFDNVEAIGTNLKINNGAVDILFNRQKIYYPREILAAPYFVNKVTNIMDKESYFRLRLGGELGSYLIDSKRIVTVGDSSIPHPKLKGLIIAKEREAMFNS